ncbi:Trans-enoyl reductase ACTTS2 [Paramyrothecium foliicola]|nr:Trans-enoyl reductase ACTTS2 [Paramyrothecium foliicola]
MTSLIPLPVILLFNKHINFAPIPTIMATMRALVLTPKEKHASVQSVPIPEPAPTEILVRVGAVALNRVDWLYTANPIAAQDRRIIGSDFAGVVTKVGRDIEDIADPRTMVGARVAGFVQGACSVNERPGAFAQYVSVEWDLTWRVPAAMTLEQAATISLCGLTAAQGVFNRLQLPCPFVETNGIGSVAAEPVSVLIYGATSSLGLFAAQLVRLSEQFSVTRIRLIGVASTSKYSLLREHPYKYDVLIDYRDADWPHQVREVARASSGVDFAIDAVSVSPTVEKVESTLAPGGRFAVFRAPAVGNYNMADLKIKPIIGAVWEGLGKEIGYQGATIPADPAAREFAARFFAFLSSEALHGKPRLMANPLRQMSGGLDKITEGLSLVSGNPPSGMRPVSAEKVVYTID